MSCNECKTPVVDDGFYKAIIRRKNHENTLLFVLCLVLIVGFAVYAIYNKWADSQFETVNESVRVISEEEGDANYINGDGDITYGRDHSK